MTPRLMRGACALVFAGALGVAGCGSSSSSSSSSADTASAPATTTTAAAPVSGSTTIVMDDYTFDPQDLTATAGKLKVTAPNKGALVHELLLAKAGVPADSLPINAAGDVVESKVKGSVGEIPEVDPGKSGSKTFDLTPGDYVMYCNVAGHYKLKMYGTLTVK